MILYFGSQQMIIGNCQNLSILFFSHAKKQPNFKRTVRFKVFIVLLPGVTTSVPVNYHEKIPENRDFFFEPQFNLNHHLKNDGNVFAHIIEVFLNLVQTYNATVIPVTIPRRTKLKSILEYNQGKMLFRRPQHRSQINFYGMERQNS